MKKIFLLLILFIFSNQTFSQSADAQNIWKSTKYKYQVEIPKGFKIAPATGVNIDFKAVKNNSSIVIVVKKLPQEAGNLTIWQILGDLDEYAVYFQAGAQEHFNTPKVIKYGKTKINNLDAFWLDYTTDNGINYYKNYFLKKGNYSFTITFFSDVNDWNTYSTTWFRFKEQIKL